MRVTGLSRATRRWNLRAVLLVATLVVVVDQLTKAWVMRELSVGQLSVSTREVIPGVLRIAYSENAGIAGGLLGSNCQMLWIRQ